MEELVTCEGTVHSIIFQNAENGYTVLRLLTEEGEVITVVGCIPCVAPGEHLAVSGVPETHPQHGEQLRAVELERSLPEDEEEIFSYLSSGICKGVGPATARRIVERFGAETLDVLEREPERLTTLKGVTARKAQEIAESFRRHMGLRRLMAFLAQYQLPPVLAMELRRQYGDAALEKEYGQSETDETEAQWQEYFARIRAGQERSRKMLTEELPERLRGLTLQGEGTQKKRWEEFLQSELAITLYKEPEFWRQVGEHVRAQEWSEEACRYIGRRVEDIKYEFNSRDYPELWRVLDELERICLEEALKDPLRRTKITLRGFGLTILVFVLIGVFVRII